RSATGGLAPQRVAAGAAAPPMVGGASARPAMGFWQSSLRRLWHNRVAMLALVGLLVLIALCFAAPLFERALGVKRDAVELLDNYQRPSGRHWFGTDEYGRDYFVRTLHGGQISILMG